MCAWCIRNGTRRSGSVDQCKEVRVQGRNGEKLMQGYARKEQANYYLSFIPHQVFLICKSHLHDWVVKEGGRWDWYSGFLRCFMAPFTDGATGGAVGNWAAVLQRPLPARMEIFRSSRHGIKLIRKNINIYFALKSHYLKKKFLPYGLIKFHFDFSVTLIETRRGN